MGRRRILTLMEQLVMLLILALCAAICVTVFVHAHRINRQAEDLDTAVILCRNGAEVIKSCRGDPAAAAAALGAELTDELLQVRYNAALQADPEGCYILKISLNRSDPFIGYADITVTRENHTIFTLTTAWQEVRS